MTMHALPIFALVIAAPPPAIAPPSPPRHDEARIEALLKGMTLEEKLGQLQQLGGDPKTGGLNAEQRELVRQGRIGSFLDVRGARNVNDVQRVAVEESRARIPILFGFDVIHGYRTIFPIPLGEASSWDPSGVEQSARVAAMEAAAAGVRWAFAPMVDIARDPRWGRIAEGSGEDPFLGSAMARAKVREFQGQDYGAPDRVAACVKHWVAYGAAEAGREYNAADVSERTLRTVYFPPFRAALDAGAGTFMTRRRGQRGTPRQGAARLRAGHAAARREADGPLHDHPAVPGVLRPSDAVRGRTGGVPGHRRHQQRGRVGGRHPGHRVSILSLEELRRELEVAE
jgi:beta-glucosidase